MIETRDGTLLRVKDIGRGRPVLFLHGFTLSAEIWEWQMTELAAAGLRCLAYDRRGHGRSDHPGDGYDFDTLADDLASVMTALDLQETTLVGHSMAIGEIVRYLSRHGAGRVARIVLAAPLPPCPALAFPSDADGRTVFDHAIEGMRADRPAYYAANGEALFGAASSPELVRWGLDLALQTALWAAIDCQRANAAADFRADLQAVTVPTLVLQGDGDRLAPADLCGRAVAEMIPGSRIEIYPGAPHGLFLTDKECFSRDLLGFIQG
ncbi:MAG: alpha/beta hydrolase [Inquilinus limosus]|uniref:Alpha/beta hydrolase n=1 Tax=Inquilinus limosus TaxID=171674 RepID=A0A952FJJ6_9PROT|nr:alpha/beta hydrolase [Inquilinus limosus]